MATEKLPSRLLGILDCGAPFENLLDLAAAAERGGLLWLLLRGPDLAGAQRVRLAKEIGERCPGLFLSIHADSSAAGKLARCGLHYPARLIGEARSKRPRGPLGVSAHDEGELTAAKAAGADYCFLSPVFPPSSKPPERLPLGLEGFGRLAAGVGLPVYALGGIGPEHVRELGNRGAAGVAVLGGIFSAADVTAATAAYVSAVGEAYRKAYG